MRRIEYLIAYTIAIASAALASLYGFMSATGYYGLAKGVGLCCVAFVGCHGPAWIAKVKRNLGWPAAIFGTLATMACLGVTLYGGLGTIASGGAQVVADARKLTDDATRAKSQLTRITAEREAMQFVATDAAAVATAEEAVRAAERVRKAECDQRGPLCRQRETEEQGKRDRLLKMRSDKALTDQAAKLDAQITSLQNALDQVPAIKTADPQASTFSQLTGLSVDTSAALYAFLFSVALETAAMFAMMVAYSTPQPLPPAASAPTSLANALEPVPAQRPASTPRTQPLLIVNNPPTISIIEFAGANLQREEGAELEFEELYLAYWQHCKASDGRPSDPAAAAQMINTLCAECKIPIERRGNKVYLIGMRLKAQKAKRSKAIGKAAS